MDEWIDRPAVVAVAIFLAGLLVMLWMVQARVF